MHPLAAHIDLPRGVQIMGSVVSIHSDGDSNLLEHLKAPMSSLFILRIKLSHGTSHITSQTVTETGQDREGHAGLGGRWDANQLCLALNFVPGGS